MDSFSLPHKLPRKSLIVYTIWFLSLSHLISLIPTTKPDPNFVLVHCPDNKTRDTYAPSSTYQANLDTLFSALSSNSSTVTNGFSSFTVGSGTSSPPDDVAAAYGLFLCRGDVNATACRDCVAYACRNAVERCPSWKSVTIWYDECMLRYSNADIFADPDLDAGYTWDSPEVKDPAHLEEVLREVMTGIADRAWSTDNYGKKFATAKANFSTFEQVYGLAQCTPIISDNQCNKCLRNGIAQFWTCCIKQRGARVLSPSCNVRYDMDQFYNASFDAALPPPSPTSNPAGNGGISWKVATGIVIPIGVAIMLFIAVITKRIKKKYDSTHETQPETGEINGHYLNATAVGDDMPRMQSLEYDLGTIQAATNNFSEDNKIGKGGFGPVYKGLLPEGKEVAVKRLSQESRQGAREFRNEVVLIAQLQHRNLVRLLGFCLAGAERILIYEFAANKSLDCFLFDPQNREKLDWRTRYRIIGGVARGMLYLHEDSQLKIIHRDLKASNILLDGDMNAKISDFGTAMLFAVDQTHASTRRVIGTFGYIAPEYVMHGKYSARSDMFSFGVLVLEIVSGEKNNNFSQSDVAASLLSFAWKLWMEETPLALMDPTLEGSHSRIEVIRCIHIALLCVQDDPNARPSMATVVQMLNSYSVTLPVPQQSAFVGQSKTGSNTFSSLESHQSTTYE